MQHNLSPADHARITAAIRAAESRTSGEIYCVVARSSDGYFFPAALLAFVALLVGSLVVAIGLEFWWLSIRLPLFVTAQVLAALCVVATLGLFPALRIHLVPHQLRHRHAHDNARKQFLARNVHLTAGRTGVLLFVSLAERYAEVVADSTIDRKVPKDTWKAAVDMLMAGASKGRLADGFADAVDAVGDVLATHFPIGSGDENELDDHLVEI